MVTALSVPAGSDDSSSTTLHPLSCRDGRVLFLLRFGGTKVTGMPGRAGGSVTPST